MRRNEGPITQDGFRQNEGAISPYKTFGALKAALGLLAFTCAISANADTRSPRVAEVVASLPKGHFMENVAVSRENDLYITDYVGRTILQYREGDGLRLVQRLDVYPVGIAAHETGFVVSAHSGSLMAGVGNTGQNVILELDADGKVTDTFAVPGARFLNGLAQIANDQFIVADSALGIIYLVDTAQNTAQRWLDDERLAPADPHSPVPAANGIKLNDGLAYISNSSKGLLLTVPADDPRPDSIKVVLSDVTIDDFVFFGDGHIFAATHSHEVLCISNQFDVSVFANQNQSISGATATAIVERKEGAYLYVVGDGGLFEGLELQPPAIVRLPLGGGSCA